MRALRLPCGARSWSQAAWLQGAPRCAPLVPLRGAQSRSATSLPQIPGVIFANQEIPEDRLVGRIRRWAASSGVAASGTFDLLQLAEKVDGRPLPKAICCILRTELLLADTEEPLKAFVTVFYRARDYLNSEFWEDQARRLSDVLADEYLGGGRGVHLMVHQNAPKWALGLEMGDHRLFTELEAMTVLGNPLGAGPGAAVAPEFLGETALDDGALAHAGHQSFHQLRRRLPAEPAAPGAAAASPGMADAELPHGRYVLRDSAGGATCGLEVLGVLPSRLVCGAAWAAEGQEQAFGALVDALRRRAGRPFVSLLADPRDGGWQRLCGRTASPLPGLYRSRKRLGVAVTGVPVGLSPEEQAKLAQAPFLVPWEFVPFHFGRLVLI